MKIATIRSADGAFKTVEGIVYTLAVKPSFHKGGPERRIWEGGPLGGYVYEKSDDLRTNTIDHFEVYGSGLTPTRFPLSQFVKAALYAQKRARQAYDVAKATVVAYEAALAAQEASE